MILTSNRHIQALDAHLEKQYFQSDIAIKSGHRNDILLLMLLDASMHVGLISSCCRQLALKLGYLEVFNRIVDILHRELTRLR